MAIGIIKRISPEYVLKCAIDDLQKDGLDRLKPYLTSNALKKVEMVQSFSNGVGLLSDMMALSLAGSQKSGEDMSAAMIHLVRHISEIEWAVLDILKGSSSTKVVLGFSYQESVEGKMELTMIKQDKEWRIDTLSMPRFEKLSLKL